jgi:Glycosyl transferases group 1
MLGSAELLEASAPASVPGLLEVHEAGAVADLEAFRPEAVVAFGPDPASERQLASLGLPALLWRGSPGPRLVLAAGDQPGAWRCVGWPVADRHFEAELPELPAGAAWLGEPTARRSSYLSWFQHTVEPAAEGSAAVVAVNLHDSDEATFEPRAARALAAGRLLVSETLAPPRGLEPGIDYLAAPELDDLYLAVESAVRDPHAFRRVRIRGRRKAELFRSSRVIARLVDDLLLELRSASS